MEWARLGHPRLYRKARTRPAKAAIKPVRAVIPATVNSVDLFEPLETGGFAITVLPVGDATIGAGL